MSLASTEYDEVQYEDIVLLMLSNYMALSKKKRTYYMAIKGLSRNMSKGLIVLVGPISNELQI